MLETTVCIATIPPRARGLRSALATVAMQTVQPRAIIVEYDHDRTGAAATKNRALYKVTTEWTAWLDDDDRLKPDHLAVLTEVAERTGCDVVYPWYDIDGNADSRPQFFGKPFDGELMRQIAFVPTTALFRTKMAQDVGGFQIPRKASKLLGEVYDDYGFWLAMLDAGANFVHVPRRTWIWNVQGQNTSGQPDRW